MNDYEYIFKMNYNDRASKDNVDRHIDNLNFDYMTEEEKVDMNHLATTTLPWSTNSYQKTTSKESFNDSIYQKQNLLEGYHSFSTTAKSVNWSMAHRDNAYMKELNQDQTRQNIYGGFLTSIEEQILDQFDRSDTLNNTESNLQRHRMSEELPKLSDTMYDRLTDNLYAG